MHQRRPVFPADWNIWLDSFYGLILCTLNILLTRGACGKHARSLSTGELGDICCSHCSHTRDGFIAQLFFFLMVPLCFLRRAAVCLDDFAAYFLSSSLLRVVKLWYNLIWFNPEDQQCHISLLAVPGIATGIIWHISLTSTAASQTELHTVYVLIHLFSRVSCLWATEFPSLQNVAPVVSVAPRFPHCAPRGRAGRRWPPGFLLPRWERRFHPNRYVVLLNDHPVCGPRKSIYYFLEVRFDL